MAESANGISQILLRSFGVLLRRGFRTCLEGLLGWGGAGARTVQGCGLGRCRCPDRAGTRAGEVPVPGPCRDTGWGGAGARTVLGCGLGRCRCPDRAGMRAGEVPVPGPCRDAGWGGAGARTVQGCGLGRCRCPDRAGIQAGEVPVPGPCSFSGLEQHPGPCRPWRGDAVVASGCCHRLVPALHCGCTDPPLPSRPPSPADATSLSQRRFQTVIHREPREAQNPEGKTSLIQTLHVFLPEYF
ncbi:uncharacterized protein LOC127060403 [Serinus canaria]|uniref:uncharacterized protein LOC127060403 n=1 Tax=Serinus canaria TaxID=9135 RepID=UPI0021CCC58F|nr:uncharacterized protein LOC127060403 [Serinus canaria]